MDTRSALIVLMALQAKKDGLLEALDHRWRYPELLMRVEEFNEELAGEMGLRSVRRLCERFGSSYEATVYRMATAYPGVALAEFSANGVAIESRILQLSFF